MGEPRAGGSADRTPHRPRTINLSSERALAIDAIAATLEQRSLARCATIPSLPPCAPRAGSPPPPSPRGDGAPSSSRAHGQGSHRLVSRRDGRLRCRMMSSFPSLVGPQNGYDGSAAACIVAFRWCNPSRRNPRAAPPVQARAGSVRIRASPLGRALCRISLVVPASRSAAPRHTGSRASLERPSPAGARHRIDAP